MLAAESKPLQSTPAQVIPESDLGVGELLAKLSCESTLVIAERHGRSITRQRWGFRVQNRQVY
jgi:hypothetical protein